ncbi:MAG: phosphatase PAP2 family protein [Fusobacteriota bacterium]
MGKKVIYIYIVFSLIISTTIFGLDFEYEKINLKADWNRIKDINNQKLEIKKKDIGKFGILVGTVFLTDRYIDEAISNIKNESLDEYTDLVNPLGGPFAGKLILGSYATGIILRNDRLKQTSFTSFESTLLAGVTTGILKHTFGRGRPEIEKESNDNPYKFKPFGTFSNKDYDSLPSGHSTIAWAMLTPFAEEYTRLIYIVPASVSFARIYKDRHWTSDVLVGGAIGFGIGYTLSKWHKKNIEFYGNGIKVRF